MDFSRTRVTARYLAVIPLAFLGSLAGLYVSYTYVLNSAQNSVPSQPSEIPGIHLTAGDLFPPESIVSPNGIT